MKKSIIALATVAAMAAQADNTTLWGSVRQAYTYDSGTSLSTNNARTVSSSTLGDYGSRWGIKGEDDLGGLTAYYYFEQRMGEDGNAKRAYAGLKGGFGAIQIGSQLLGRDNLSNNSSPDNLLGPGYGRSAVTDTQTGLAYMTPDMGGFQITAAVAADGASGNHRHIDTYDIMAEYKANGLYAGLGYQSTNKSAGNDTSNLGLGLGYGNDMFSVGLLVEQSDTEGSDANPLFARIGGSYNITSSDSVYASVSMYDDDVNGTDDVVGALLGYQHNFSKRTRVWAEYGYRDETSSTADNESNKIAVGIRTDF